MRNSPFPITHELFYWASIVLPVAWTAARILNQISYGLFLAVDSFLLVLFGVCSHEAIHGIASNSIRRNNAIGWIAAFLAGSSFDLQRRSHSHHHARSGTDLDFESNWVRSHSKILFLAKCLLFNWSFYSAFPYLNKTQKIRSALVALVVMAIAVTLPLQFVTLWFVPACLASFLFSFFFVYLPHQTQPSLVEIVDRFPVMTNYHQMHHDFPGRPWYQGRSLFHRQRRATR